MHRLICNFVVSRQPHGVTKDNAGKQYGACVDRQRVSGTKQFFELLILQYLHNLHILLQYIVTEPFML